MFLRGRKGLSSEIWWVTLSVLYSSHRWCDPAELHESSKCEGRGLCCFVELVPVWAVMRKRSMRFSL